MFNPDPAQRLEAERTGAPFHVWPARGKNPSAHSCRAPARPYPTAVPPRSSCPQGRVALWPTPGASVLPPGSLSAAARPAGDRGFQDLRRGRGRRASVTRGVGSRAGGVAGPIGWSRLEAQGPAGGKPGDPVEAPFGRQLAAPSLLKPPPLPRTMKGLD